MAFWVNPTVETRIGLLLPEQRQLGQSVITDQGLYAQEGHELVVSDKPTCKTGSIHLPSGLPPNFLDGDIFR